MRSDDLEPAEFRPSFFVMAFSLIGGFIAVSAMAAIVAVVFLFLTGWNRYTYSISGLAWGSCARLLELSVRRGIHVNVRSDELSPQQLRVLGEQVAMLQITRWFVRIELLVSVVLLLVELIHG